MIKRTFSIAAGIVLGSVLALGMARVALSWGLFSNRDLDKSAAYVKEVMELVNKNYVDTKSADYTKLTRSALHGMVESLDPHSEFMEKRDFDELEEDMNSEFGGIGVQIEFRSGHVLVIAPIAGTPGERAGIRRGDEIVRIDGKPMQKPSMDDVVEKLRGQPKTKVTVGFYRPSTKQEFELTLTREIIKMDSIRDVQIMAGDIGFIQITQFTERTGEEFINALNKLGAQGIRGLVIDLRNNPGGLLDAAVDVAEPFFKKGELIVYTQGRTLKDREEFRAESDEPQLDVPTAVLINSGSASAAEIVAGALKDTHRAVIVGERSFGKGSVQSIIKLENGEGMRLTTARYFTPSGTTIHEHGIEPDVEVVMSPEEDQNISLQRSRTDVMGEVEFKERFGVGPVTDRQLNAALSALRGVILFEDRGEAAAPALSPTPAPKIVPVRKSTK